MLVPVSLLPRCAERFVRVTAFLQVIRRLVLLLSITAMSVQSQEYADNTVSYEMQRSAEDSPLIVIRNRPATSQLQRKMQQTSLGLSVFNLCNEMLGSGIFALPNAMSNSGVLVFSVFLTMMALVAIYSVHLLLSMCDLTAVVSYLIIIKVEGPSVVSAILRVPQTDSHWYLDGSHHVLIVLGCVIVPLCLLPRIGFLGYASGIVLVSLFYYTGVVIYERPFYPCPLPDVPIDANASNATIATVLGSGLMVGSEACSLRLVKFSSKTAYVLPIISYSMVCQTSLLPVYSELSRPSKGRMQLGANIAIGLCFCIYFVSAYFGYTTFYDNVGDELLSSYASFRPYNALILSVRVAALTVVTLSVPMLLYPGRLTIERLLFPGRPFSWVRHVILTFVLLAVLTLLALFVPKMSYVLGLSGATGATSLCFILPGWFYFAICPGSRWSSKKLMALAVMGLGLVICIVSISGIITSWIIAED